MSCHRSKLHFDVGLVTVSCVQEKIMYPALKWIIAVHSVPMTQSRKGWDVPTCLWNTSPVVAWSLRAVKTWSHVSPRCTPFWNRAQVSEHFQQKKLFVKLSTLVSQYYYHSSENQLGLTSVFHEQCHLTALKLYYTTTNTHYILIGIKNCNGTLPHKRYSFNMCCSFMPLCLLCLMPLIITGENVLHFLALIYDYYTKWASALAGNDSFRWYLV